MCKTERFGKYIVHFFIDLSLGSREVTVSINGKRLKHHVDFNYNNHTDERDLQSVAYEFIRDLENK